MHEQDKIEEAEYFYSRMIESNEEAEAFKHNLSAFLSAARSVLQYAHAEVKIKPSAKVWYQAAVNGNTVVSFFKDKRDVNIHSEPVTPTRIIGIHINEHINVTETVIVVKKDAKGNIIEKPTSDPTTQEKKLLEPAVRTIKYKFDDWAGGEDVQTLCKKYLDELKNIVADGRRKGSLT